jgi:uncharacterized protein (TIGR03000 family)
MRGILLTTVVGLGVAAWLANVPVALADSGDAPVVINAIVPTDAKLYVDGTKTKQTGDNRRFVSPPIRSGHVYVYHVRVVSDGRDVEKAVRVRAGDDITIDFTGQQVREWHGQPVRAYTPSASYVQQSWYSGPAQARVRTFAQQTPYGGYSWSSSALPFPEWNQLAIPTSQRYPNLGR